jgi:hypothetical protein
VYAVSWFVLEWTRYHNVYFLHKVRFKTFFVQSKNNKVWKYICEIDYIINLLPVVSNFQFNRQFLNFCNISTPHSTRNTDKKGKTCVNAFGTLKLEVRTSSLQKKLNSNLFWLLDMTRFWFKIPVEKCSRYQNFEDAQVWYDPLVKTLVRYITGIYMQKHCTWK